MADEELSWVARLLISLSLTASLLGIGGAIGYIGNVFYVDIDNKRVTTSIIQEQRDLLRYDNSPATADDIYTAVIKYTRVLPITIQYDNWGVPGYLTLDINTTNPTIWTKDYLKQYIPDSEGVYHSYLMRGNAGEITGIVFYLL